MGNRHPLTLESISNIATVLHALGEYRAEEQFLVEGHFTRQLTLGKEHPCDPASLVPSSLHF